jgi:CHAD domain-containing protein
MSQASAASIHYWSRDPAAFAHLEEALTSVGVQVRDRREFLWDETYLDTRERWLMQAGAAYSIRTGLQGATAALTPLTGEARLVVPGPSLEESTSPGPPSLPVSIPEGRLGEWLRASMGDRSVAPVLRVQRQRTLCALATTDGPMVQVAFDLIRPRGLPAFAPFVELEAEARADSLGEVEPIVRELADTLGLTPADGSTLLRGLEAAGAVPPAPTDDEDQAPQLEDRFVDAAYRVLRRHFGRVLWNEPGTRLGLDVEHLHDMRVASRRLRAALKVFKHALPARRAKAFRRDLKWLGEALGRVRDLDVHLLHLREETLGLPSELRAGMQLYGGILLARRDRAQASLLKLLETARYGRFIDRMKRFLDAGAPTSPGAPGAREPVTAGARKVIEKRMAKVRTAGGALSRGSSDEELHQMRILCKRLRYACEFFADLYGPAALKFVRRVTKLQDLLGAHQDAVVARRMLRELAEEFTGPRDRVRSLYLALGALIVRHDDRADRSRKDFFKAWKKFGRKKVRKPLLARLDKLGS